jgi:hypothetical protein
MKKWNYLLSMFLIAGTVFVTSCSKDEDDPPTLDLKGTSGYTSNDVTISAGETIRVGVIAAAGTEKLSSFNLTVRHNNIDEYSFDTTLNVDNFNMDFEIPFTSEFIGENLVSMKVVDKGGNTASQSFKVTVETGAVAINKYSGVLLGSFNDVNGSFYNTTENTVYTISAAKANQAKVDLLFYFGADHKNTLAAPNDPDVNAEITTFQLNTWTTKNATKFIKGAVTAAQFDAIVDDFNFPTFDESSALSYADKLVDGDVVFFKTVTGKLGLAKVVDLTARGDQGTFDFIIEE